MNEKISSEKALEDLKIIKKTIDRSTQAEIITDMFIAMGTTLVVSGVVVMFLCGVTYLMLKPAGMTPDIKKQLIIIWSIAFVLLGVLKMLTFHKKGKEMNLSLFSYLTHAMKGSFIGLDLPLELAAFIILIFLVKIGMIQYVPAITAIWSGELFAVMGTVFINKHFTKAGYLYIFLGSIGLLFMGNHVLIFIAVTFGLVMGIFGISILVKTKKDKKELHNEK